MGEKVSFVIHNKPLPTLLEGMLMRQLWEDAGWLPEEPIKYLKSVLGL